ncbi:MAG: Holliday junction ATP-dependent DNA helicase RuvA, partial [Planctomycetota bacterium]
MISHLRGRVVSVSAGTCVMECAGVGYEVHCPVETASRLKPGQEALLHVHHHLSVDHAGGGGELLYGFSAPEDKTVFRLLMTVSGVGPRL